jgi:transposase
MASEQRDFGTEISGNREINHEFTPEQRAAMVAEIFAGRSYRQVAVSYHTDLGTVYWTKKRWDQYHNNALKLRKGRPQKLSALKIVRINSFIARNRIITWNEALFQLDLKVTLRTLRRHLERYWRRKWRVKKRIKLIASHAKERLEHARFWIQHIEEYIVVIHFLRWGILTLTFSQICFTDKVTVVNTPNNPDSWVFRRPDEKYRKDLVNVQHHVKPTISTMFWGAIARNKQSYLIPMTRDLLAERNGYSSWSYRKALTEGLLPFLDKFKQFQQDNARIHTA